MNMNSTENEKCKN